MQDRRRTFIWAEISYFSWWWDEQDDGKKEDVKNLLRNGQLEFVTGGWVQPDEANSELYALEIQLEEGFDWIRENIGEEFIPKYGWSIDPFGYSPTMAYLLKKKGFRAMLIQRVHYAVKKELARRQHLEFMWRQTWDSTGEHDIFTHLMPFFSYDVPHTCGPEPAVCCQFDFARMKSVHSGVGSCPWGLDPQVIDSANLKERALRLADQYMKKAALYRSDTVLVPLGDDFRFRSKSEAEAQFVNLQKLFDYMNSNIVGMNVKFGTLSEYFERVTSQVKAPFLKGSFFTYSDVDEDYWSGYFTSRAFDKGLDRRLERILYAAETLGISRKELVGPRRELSLFQHHDGITGTAREHVVRDNAFRLWSSIGKTQDLVVAALTSKFQMNENYRPCWESREARGLPSFTCDKNAEVFAYNPLETPQQCGSIIIEGKHGANVKLPCERIRSPNANFQFDSNGMMTAPIREQWMTYKVQRGGAYLFFPGKLDQYKAGNFTVEQGGIVVKSEYWNRTIYERTFTGPDYEIVVIDFDYETDMSLGHRQMKFGRSPENNQEWFVRFSANISNHGVFHTDLNGFNFDTHHLRKDLPPQSQVFPMPTFSSIEDELARMSIVSEHSQGTASFIEGSIDVWLDRRLGQDDGKGLGQPVLDNMPTRTRLRVILEYSNLIQPEFQITPPGKRLWDELQHPLEFYGRQNIDFRGKEAIANPLEVKKERDMHRIERAEKRKALSQRLSGENGGDLPQRDSSLNDHEVASNNTQVDEEFTFGYDDYFESGNITVEEGREIPNQKYSVLNTSVPFVYMVHKRDKHFKEAMRSLLASDFPREKVPIVISHDGRVKDMIDFVKSMKAHFLVIEWFHPFSCYDRPTSFPGDDASLNVGYEGDSYGNPRSPWATCAKHHFTWMLNEVYRNEKLRSFDSFVFLEEDYIVSGSVYSAIISGMNVREKLEEESGMNFFAVAMDPSRGDTVDEPIWYSNQSWYSTTFSSGPMVLSRNDFGVLAEHKIEYCTFDDYNWDWSIVHLQRIHKIPYLVLMPSRKIVRHIGVDKGMHVGNIGNDTVGEESGSFFPFPFRDDFESFSGQKFIGKIDEPLEELENPAPGYGGFNHPRDHEHCINLFK